MQTLLAAWHGREGVRRGKMSVREETGLEGWMSMIKANDQSFALIILMRYG